MARQNIGRMMRWLIMLIMVVSVINCKNKDIKRAPNFTLEDLQGNKHSLSDYADEIVVLDFWATWCAPCRVEIPHLKRIQNKYKEKGVVVIGVAVSDRKDRVRDFVQQMDINYLILMGTNRVAQTYKIKAIPTTYVLDRGNLIHKKFVGFYPGMENVLMSIIDSLMTLEPQ
ncbi:hypothetical protein CGW93_01495 [candidate division bacterium WOR-3 4484_18]|uniref:Thioredoxin domain-containing protein n=1 Tax=candidate division WOR-3 bacterium 4484_18 TaxID=2020626 RepID=A0A257LUJ0_UNCW3|nr:MAG: hypothetical protein CGW93_01495 [candidate division bacterium WOR-3 4484_18]